MKVSELWLRALINPPVTTAGLVEQLTHVGIEIDGVDDSETTPGAKVFTLKVPANRGDCLSVEGLVREIAVINALPFQAIEVPATFPTVSQTFPVKIESQKECPRYISRIIQNINPKAVIPAWLLHRLQDAGIRSVSPVVDILNYVMLEIGQPLHAFDLSRLESEIVVRYARQGERIITLEGKEVELDTETLIVADSQKPIAIAGIMGGENSAVLSNTQNIILESAFFDPIGIRGSSQRLNIRTESSHRFERGVDPHLQERALERATELLLEVVGGNPSVTVEHLTVSFLPPIHPISLRTAKIKSILGISPEPEEIQNILIRLGMECTPNFTGFQIIRPSFRMDITHEIDLIEEVARIYGFHRIPKANPYVPFEFISLPENKISIRQFKQALVGRGYYEAITYSFLDRELSQHFSPNEPLLSLENPISDDLSVMRNSLWPGLIKVVQYNQRRQQPRLRLFEAGLCFTQEEGSLQQKNRLAGVCTGSFIKEQWGAKAREVDFYDIKSDVEALFAITKDKPLHFEEGSHPALHPGQTAKIYRNSEFVGYVGALHPRLIKILGIQGSLLAFELDLDRLEGALIPKFAELSKYPAIRRDIAIIVDKTVLAEDLKSAIVKKVGTLARDVLIFDVYQGSGIEAGKKSVAIGLILQHPSRTLVETEINELVQELLQNLSERYHAILRE
jgi:phenylalanyl-tRNA synthetase beta chain